MEQMYNVSSSPHTRINQTTQKIMLDVILALIPASVFGVWYFGFKALVILVVSIVCCVVSEGIYDYFMNVRKNKNSLKETERGEKRAFKLDDLVVTDLSAVLTGLLLGMNLPPTVPLYIPILGSIFAIIVVKQIFGGLGQNFMNPALAARCFLLISFAGQMTDFKVDGVSTATPLQLLKETGETIDFLTLLAGNTAGTIGETSAIFLLLGAVYLFIKKIISIHIPLTYMVSFALCILFFGEQRFDGSYVLSQILTGGLIMGAFFMATDYVTSPITVKGKIVFGITLGILTGIFRSFGPSAEGVSYAIILGNVLVPLIEKVTMPRAFGRGKSYGKK